jgi:multidrug transporter EmrE-like cation transporter
MYRALLWICLPLFNTLNQVAMKLTAGAVADTPFGVEWLLTAAHSPYIWMSFACELVNFVVWMEILKRHSLSQAFPLTGITYVSLMLTSWFLFHEPMHAQQLLGILVIIAGIMLMGFKPAAAGESDTIQSPD